MFKVQLLYIIPWIRPNEYLQRLGDLEVGEAGADHVGEHHPQPLLVLKLWVELDVLDPDLLAVLDLERLDAGLHRLQVEAEHNIWT